MNEYDWKLLFIIATVFLVICIVFLISQVGISNRLLDERNDLQEKNDKLSKEISDIEDVEMLQFWEEKFNDKDFQEKYIMQFVYDNAKQEIDGK